MSSRCIMPCAALALVFCPKAHMGGNICHCVKLERSCQLDRLKSCMKLLDVGYSLADPDRGQRSRC